MKKTEWVRCPVCGNKTRNQIREDTVLLNFPLYCPKCKQEMLIEAKQLQVTVIDKSNTPPQAAGIKFETPQGGGVFDPRGSRQGYAGMTLTRCSRE